MAIQCSQLRRFTGMTVYTEGHLVFTVPKVFRDDCSQWQIFNVQSDKGLQEWLFTVMAIWCLQWWRLTGITVHSDGYSMFTVTKVFRDDCSKWNYSMFTVTNVYRKDCSHWGPFGIHSTEGFQGWLFKVMAFYKHGYLQWWFFTVIVNQITLMFFLTAG